MKPVVIKNSPIVSIIILIIMTFCCQAVNAESGQQVKTDKDIYNAGETISVSFINAPGSNRDWICIAAAGS
jgi:hypothetical protein